MRSLRTSTALLLFGALVVSANAGQRFTFLSPAGSNTASNALFSLFLGGPTADLKNRVGYTQDPSSDQTNQTVDLFAYSFTPTGVYTGFENSTARYFLRTRTQDEIDTNTFDLTDYARNNVFEGSGNVSGGFAANGGLLTFVDLDSPESVLLQITFASSIISQTAGGTAGFRGASEMKFVGGDFLNPSDVGNENFSFALIPISGSTSLKTANFTSSTGTVGVVPEPASMAGLAVGALALLRRRKRS